MRSNPLAAALAAAISQDRDDDAGNDTKPMAEANAIGRATQLTELFQAYQQKHTFKPGDLVVWKAGQRTHRFPAYGEPVVILEVFDAPTRDMTGDSGSPYYMSEITGRIGRPDEDGALQGWCADFNRFEPYQQA